MLTRYVWRDLVRNPRRTLSTMAGITLGVGLFSAVLFFIDGSSASMTQRAVAPLPIDMQRVLTPPLGGGLRLDEEITPAGRTSPGDVVTVVLTLTNGAQDPANEVILRSQPPSGAGYVPGSTLLDGVPVDDGAGELPLARGPAKTGLNLGTLPPGGTVEVSYQVEVSSASPARTLRFNSSFSTREVLVPVAANAPEPVGLEELVARVAELDGVAFAHPLAFVDLPAGSLSGGGAEASGGGTELPGPMRLFGFSSDYREHYSDIELLDGSQEPGKALVSAEAAQDLDIGPGDSVQVALPGSVAPLDLTVSGVVDVSRARALFYSRMGANLEDFVYTRNSVVIDPETFAGVVVPAFQHATTGRGELVKSRPILEVDIGVERARLDSDPGRALGETAAIAEAVTAAAPGQDYLIDNISNTLTVAREDAALAKRMFVFLGIPGGLLAATLAGYAGSVLAGAQRREQSILRIRGANRSHLLRMLALRTLLLTAAGSLFGTAMGFASAATVLGSAALGRASAASLITSGLLGAASGFLATGTALYAAGRGAVTRDINDDRARLHSRPPLWRRARLDLAAALVLLACTVIALRTDAFAGVPGSVYEGRGIELQLWLLVLPLGAWLALTLLIARGAAHGVSRLRLAHPFQFPRLVPGIFGRSLRRRSWATVNGMIIIALVVGMGTSVAGFTASYDRAKSADARFASGADIRVVPGPTSADAIGPEYARELEVPGVAVATPVVFSVLNSVLRSERNEDAINLASVEPETYLEVAGRGALDPEVAAGVAGLAEDPTGIMLSEDMARFLTLKEGDPVGVLFGMGTDEQVMSTMHVAGIFERLPAFPEGAGAVINIAEHERLVTTRPDFFLLRTANATQATLEQAVDNLGRGPGSTARLEIVSREAVLDKDQSSLAALNIRGLLTLDSSYALGMGTIAVAIFVFGLLLQRRREYVTMRAQGLHAREIRALIVADAAAVGIGGCIAGVAIGAAMAYYLVNVLRPLFVLAPPFDVPAGRVLLLTALVLAATAVTSIAATSLVNRLNPTELLRDE